MSNQESIIVQKILHTIEGVKALYLFGSTVTKDTHSRSDVDLALSARQPIDPVKLWNLAQDIAHTIGKDVDLVDLDKASTVFRFQIINSAKRIFAFDTVKCDAMENLWDSMYLRLNEERKEILQDYKNKGNYRNG